MGNMGGWLSGFGFCPVHPHLCGEHCFLLSATLRPYGSSPRMWGTLDANRHNIRGIRFIPTYVGNIALQRARSAEHTVHPHLCGEHDNPQISTSSDIGSSPRMWGTFVDTFPLGDSVRFIPTNVGNIPLTLYLF